jgi:hypothetical protein
MFKDPPPRGRLRGPFRQSNGRDPDSVTLLEPVLGLGPSLVYTHLTLAQQAINTAFRNPFKDAQQKIIDPLTCLFSGYINPLNGWFLQIFYARDFTSTRRRLLNFRCRGGFLFHRNTEGWQTTGCYISI